VKKITVSVTVGDGYPYSDLKCKSIKNALAQAALERIDLAQLDLIAIEATVGTVRKRR
jgi:hypothetical protein